MKVPNIQVSPANGPAGAFPGYHYIMANGPDLNSTDSYIWKTRTTDSATAFAVSIAR